MKIFLLQIDDYSSFVIYFENHIVQVNIILHFFSVILPKLLNY